MSDNMIEELDAMRGQAAKADVQLLLALNLIGEQIGLDDDDRRDPIEVLKEIRGRLMDAQGYLA